MLGREGGPRQTSRRRPRPRRLAVGLGTALVAICLAVGPAAWGEPTTTTTAPAGPPSAAPPPPARPGGSAPWQPAGRQGAGQPLLWLAQLGAATVAWMPPKLARAVVVPGTGDPGGPWPWGGQVDPGSQPLLIAAFNGGFKWGDFSGGILTFGRAYRDLAPGIASFVVYANGRMDVGEWGREINFSPDIVAVRQNLPMLVDGGAPTPAASGASWGASVAGIATARSAVGIDANGGLVWAGGRLSPIDLASALVAGGAVRGMQMDINPDWVNFNLYQLTPDGVVHGEPVQGATSADRYLHPDSRDFIAILVRGVVMSGTGAVGFPPLHSTEGLTPSTTSTSKAK